MGIADRVGYKNGFIYMDPTSNTTGTTIFVHGTVDNPVNNFKDAKALSDALGIEIKSLNREHPLIKAVREATKEK